MNNLPLEAPIWAAVAAACLMGCGLTAGARWLAPRIGLLDRPDGGRKLQTRPMPLLGGAAIYAALLLVGAAIGLGWFGAAAAAKFGSARVGAVLLSAGLFCLLGLWDDRVGLRPRDKLLGQLLAAAPCAFGGLAPTMLRFLGVHVPLGEVGGALFALFWLVACSNVINLLDGLDGLAGGVGLVLLAALAALASPWAHGDLQLLALLGGGAIVGFLTHNWPPAKIYLGDCGSLLIGLLVGALSLGAMTSGRGTFMLTMPLALLSVPIFDTAMAIVRRKLTGRSIGSGDRGHIHHCLLDRGLSKRGALLAVTGLSFVMALQTLAIRWHRSEGLALLGCGSTLGLLILLNVFGRHEASLAADRVRALFVAAPEEADQEETPATLPFPTLDADSPAETRRAA